MKSHTIYETCQPAEWSLPRNIGKKDGREGGGSERSERQSFLRGELSEGPPRVGQAPQPGSNGVREEGPAEPRAAGAKEAARGQEAGQGGSQKKQC